MSPVYFRPLLAVLLAGGVLAGRSPADEKPRPRTDYYGDPLPPGAVARLGTVRLRVGEPVIFSTDGKTLLSVGVDLAVYRWDPATGKTLQRAALELPPLDISTSDRYGFRLTPDGKTLAVAAEQSLYVLDATTGKMRRRIPVPLGERDRISRIALSPNGRSVAASVYGLRRPIYVWDTATGKERFRMEEKLGVDHLTFSPDGKTLAAVVPGQHVRLWDVASGKEIRTWRGGDFMWSVVFSPDGTLLAAGMDGGAVKLWRVDTGEELATLRGLAPGAPVSLTFSPDGKSLAAGWQAGLALWDVATRKQRFTRDGAARGLFFSPDGKTLGSRDGGAVLSFRDVDTGRLVRRHAGHEDELAAVAYSPDGKLIATGCRGSTDRGVHLWDVATGKLLRTLKGHESRVREIIFTPDGKGLISGGGDGTLRLWNVRTGEELRKYAPRGNGGRRPDLVYGMAVSADGKRLVSVSGETPSIEEGRSTPALIVWDVATGKQLVRRPEPGGFNVTFSPDAEFLAVSIGPSIFLRETATGKELLTLTLPTAKREVQFNPLLAISPDGKLLAATSSEYTRTGDKLKVKRTLHLWELVTGKQVRRAALDRSWPLALAFSPDGRTLSIAGTNLILLSGVATGKELLRYRGPNAISFATAFSPDGTTLAAAYWDSTALIWDLTPGVKRAGMPAKDLTARDLGPLWAALAGDDAAKAHTAVWALVAAPERAVAALRERLKPAVPVDPRRLRQLVKDLDSPTFAVREGALTALKQIADQAEPLLRAALENKPSLELRRRIEEVLAQSHVIHSPEVLRRIRAIQVLEQIGTKEARRLLQKLAEGAPAARATREAKASLGRHGRDL